MSSEFRRRFGMIPFSRREATPRSVVSPRWPLRFCELEMTQDLKHELKTAIEAVRTAAIICRSVQQKISPDVLEKKDRSPVTVADFASQAVICKHLKAHFPNDPIIGEEDATELRHPEKAEFLNVIRTEIQGAGIEGTDEDICGWIDHANADQYSDRFWTLDPIDGTKGFLRKEQYAISLALIVNGKVTVAAVGCPNLPAGDLTEASEPGSNSGCLFSAVAGSGAFVQSFEEDSEPVRITVSETTQSSDSRLCESVESGHSSHSDSAKVAELLGISKEPARLDSQAKYAVVARGEADIYLRLPTRPGYVERIWDHAGGVLVVEEAGGTVTDITGTPLDFTCGAGLETNRGVVVSNGNLHDSVIAALQQIGVQ